jgi:peroxiredoxin
VSAQNTAGNADVLVRLTKRTMRDRRRHPKKQDKPTTRRPIGMLLVGVGLLVLGFVASVMLLARNSQAGNRPAIAFEPARVEYPAPDLQLENLDGELVSLASLHGSVVLVNNWATWCPPCKAEMPTLQAYYTDHAQDGFVILAVEAGEPASEVAQFANNYRLTFPVLLDPDQKSLLAFANFTLPNSYLIDRQGTVRLAWNGGIDRPNLEKYVTPILEEK